MTRQLLFAFATLLAACGAQNDDTGESGLTGIIAHPIPIKPHVGLTIDSLEPAVPIEGQPVIVHFSLANFSYAAIGGRVKATVSPIAAAQFPAQESFPVVSLANFAEVKGVVSFIAPAPGHLNFLDVFFEDGTTAAHTADASQNFDVAGRYTFSVAATCDNPRSHSQDTDYLMLAGVDGNNNVVFNRVSGLGNLGGSQTSAEIYEQTPVALVPDVDQFKVSLLVVNWGNTNGPPNQSQLEDISSRFATGQLSPQQVTSINPWWSFVIPYEALFECDGTVISDLHTWTGRQLFDLARQADSSGYADFKYHGYASMPACGETSNYDAAWGVHHVPATYQPNLFVSNPLAFVYTVGGSVQLKLNQPADFFVDGGAANGSIDAGGKYTAPAGVDLTNRLITIRMVSKDGTKTSFAYVTQDRLTSINHPIGPINVGGLHL
jgi:hypothetical protein